MQIDHINMSAPNLLHVCVDQKTEGRICGRLYHCYRKEPILFGDVVELIREAEALFDALNYPQASTMSRRFGEGKGTGTKGKPEKVLTQQEILRNKGEKGTFIIHVRFRQSATWQGEICKVETGETSRFSNTLDCIKVLDGVDDAGIAGSILQA